MISFETLAEIIRETRKVPVAWDNLDVLAGVDITALHIASVSKGLDDSFDQNRFLKLCGFLE